MKKLSWKKTINYLISKVWTSFIYINFHIFAELLHVENEIEKILKLEMSELFKKLSKNPVLDFEVELKEELFQKCAEAEILNQV